MKVQVDIKTATTIRTHVPWPQEPYPSIGDQVLFRRNDQTWAFRVTDRLVAMGTDPLSGAPMMHVSLTVDTEAPAGWGG